MAAAAALAAAAGVARAMLHERLNAVTGAGHPAFSAAIMLTGVQWAGLRRFKACRLDLWVRSYVAAAGRRICAQQACP